MWYNNFTGEVYDSLVIAILTIISDMVHYRACRTTKIFDIERYTPKHNAE